MSSDSTTPQSRVIVLCFDGTSNQFDETNTNVVKFYALLNKCCPLEQIVYYQPGVGTYFNPGVVSPLFTWIATMADVAIAWYLDEHVRAGYKFLMQNYRAGDRICLFGFSRGAYTARALAGLLHKIGLLPRDNDEQVAFAYSLYKRTDKAGEKLAEGFKKTFCAPVSIDFLGVWDTVASVGVIYGRSSLPFTTANSAVRVFRHALSLDERRARYQPNMFHREEPKGDPKHRDDSEHADETAPPPEPPADVLEVWFAGCHSDVGAGAVEDDVAQLGNVSLLWMVKQVSLSKCGIKFDAKALDEAKIDVRPQSLPREQDVLAAIHDRLRTKPLWWILELIPMKFTWQKEDGTWDSKRRMNLGRGREIRSDHPNFHVSVKQRMDNADLKYKPKAKWTPGTEKYVE